MATKKSTPHTKPVETPEGNRDRVAAVSYRADGTPDQSDGFVVIGEAAPAAEPQTPQP